MILCCGEALIDFIPVPGIKAYEPVAGGSILNVAVALSRLKIPTGFLCNLSTDIFGNQLINHLKENSVSLEYCQRMEAPSTLAFVSLPEDGDYEPQYAFYANQSADRSLNIKQLPILDTSAVRALHFGSISLVLEPGATALEHLMKREYGNRIISLDPNVRPGLITDRDRYRERFEGWVATVDILKLSVSDFEWIYPNLSLQTALDIWFDLGVRLCVVTQGSEGAQGYTPSGTAAFAPALHVEVIDTVGAGDTVMAGLLAFLHEQKMLNDRQALESISVDRLEECLKFAVRAAGITCTRKGADPPRREEIV